MRSAMAPCLYWAVDRLLADLDRRTFVVRRRRYASTFIVILRRKVLSWCSLCWTSAPSPTNSTICLTSAATSLSTCCSLSRHGTPHDADSVSFGRLRADGFHRPCLRVRDDLSRNHGCVAAVAACARLISKHQYGFLARWPTCTQLLECTNDWSLSLNARNSVDCAYIDFSKAFDSVVHSKLCCNL